MKDLSYSLIDKLKTLFLLLLVCFLSLPTEFFSHAGSKRAFFDQKGSVRDLKGIGDLIIQFPIEKELNSW